MAEQAIPLTYKGHPLRRKDSLIYYGSMAEKYIIMLQVLDQKKEKDMDVATKVSVQLPLTDPALKSRVFGAMQGLPLPAWGPVEHRRVPPPEA